MTAAHADIRHAEPGDRSAVMALADRLLVGVAAWRDQDAVTRAVRSWVATSLEGADPVASPVLVAVQDGQVVGFVTTGTRPHWSGATDAYVGELVVTEERAGRGVGTALMRSAEEWAKGAGHRRLTLETGAANTGARNFYRRLGYVEEGVVLTREL